MNGRIEDHILSQLLHNEKYARAVLPFLEVEYFQEKHEQTILREVSDFFNKFNALPSKDILAVRLADRTDLSDTGLATTNRIVESLLNVTTNFDWLMESTEKFCKQKSVYNAILKSIKIIDGEDPKLTEEAIPSLLSDALAVSFNTEVGHAFLEDAEKRWEFYHAKEDKIPFDLHMLNLITGGGLAKKALYCVGAQSGGGKSLLMTHVAAACLKQGKNVLYITLEMAEERIAERIDANLMNIDISKLGDMSKDEFLTKIDKIKSKTHGNLVIKEYPTGSAHAGHFRALLEELKIKKNFIPDLICIDYLGICASSRMKMGGSVNSYSYLKSIAEELRGLAVEFNVPIFTGAQLNRGGFDNSDVDLSSTADSMGIVHTFDVYFALIRTDELDEQGTVMVKQLKNRYSDPSTNKRFLLGLNRPKMKFYDVEESAQAGIQEEAKAKTYAPRKKEEPDVPLFDRSNRNKTLDTSGFTF